MRLIVSVMPRSLEEAQAIDVMRYHDADIIEWRADFLPKEAILQVAPAIFEKFAGRELVFPNLVLSYHNFQETPENLMEILSELTSLNPKVVKIAVMAHTEQDVLDLMNFTRGFKTLNPEQEYVTVSMGKVGKVSRITSDVTGSSWSFASLDEASAPGQISLSSMQKIRELLNED